MTFPTSKNERTARDLLATLGNHLSDVAYTKDADVLTLCKQAEQTAALARAELEDARREDVAA